MATYKNPWVSLDRYSGPEFYETDARPTEYKGYLIYHRVKSTSPGGDVYDIVKDGVCVTQLAGLGGAKRAIDKITNS